MSLSEDEAEERLAMLRRQREALDREIADLVLYLELGRRLNANPARPVPAPTGTLDTMPVSMGDAVARRETTSEPGGFPTAPIPDDPPRPTAPMPPLGVASPIRRTPAPEPVAFAEDPTGARRYGRALVEAACHAIASAGRPLHARDIHDLLIARGFVIPGRDPVASLNTRLWKRSGEGGPLRRHGEAVYGLAQE